jgi:hypothetical protein
MNGPRYLPAIRTKVHSLRLGRVSVRTCDDRELGKLAGFVIDPRGHQVLSLVVERTTDEGSQQVELALLPMRLDVATLALRLIEPDVPSMTAFRPESVSRVDEDDLWIPLVHTAA